MATNIIEKVKKLMRMARDKGASENEVEQALRHAQRLIAKHNIDKSLLSDEPQADVEGILIDIDIQPGHRLWSYRLSLWSVIAEANFCEVLRVKIEGRQMFHIVGREDNAEIVIDLVKFCVKNYRKLQDLRWRDYKQEKLTSHRGYSVFELSEAGIMSDNQDFEQSYYGGVTDGLKIALAEEKEASAEMEGYGLMVINNDKAISTYVAENYPDLQSVTSTVTIKRDGYDVGVYDGSQFKKK